MNALELKNNRKKMKLSQEELGVKLGLSKNTIYNYENGAVIPKSKIPILVDFFSKNTGDKNISITEITEEEALKAIEMLYLHEDSLMKYENFALWVESKKAEERNSVLKELLKKKLDGM